MRFLSFLLFGIWCLRLISVTALKKTEKRVLTYSMLKYSRCFWIWGSNSNKKKLFAVHIFNTRGTTLEVKRTQPERDKKSLRNVKPCSWPQNTVLMSFNLKYYPDMHSLQQERVISGVKVWTGQGEVIEFMAPQWKQLFILSSALMLIRAVHVCCHGWGGEEEGSGGGRKQERVRFQRCVCERNRPLEAPPLWPQGHWETECACF